MEASEAASIWNLSTLPTRSQLLEESYTEDSSSAVNTAVYLNFSEQDISGNAITVKDAESDTL